MYYGNMDTKMESSAKIEGLQKYFKRAHTTTSFYG